MVEKLNTMNSERFEELAMAYGGDIARWPTEDQRAGQAFLAKDSGASAILNEALELDAVLGTLETPQPSDDLMARILGDAADIAAEQSDAASVAVKRPAKARRGWRLFAPIGGFAPAMALAASLVLGFGAGFAGGLGTGGEDADLVASVFEDGSDEIAALFDDDETLL